MVVEGRRDPIAPSVGEESGGHPGDGRTCRSGCKRPGVSRREWSGSGRAGDPRGATRGIRDICRLAVRARSLGKASGIEKTVPNFLLLAFAAVAAAEAFFTEVVV